MKLINSLFEKMNEASVLKVVEWCHRHKIRVEKLTEKQIMIASKTYIKPSSHDSTRLF